MQTFDIIKELEEQGKLALLVKAGMVKPNTRIYYLIFQFYNEQKKKKYTLRSAPIENTMDHFGVSRRFVYNAISFYRNSCT